MKHSYFVTGTDTEIGKTLVTAAFVYKLNTIKRGSASAYKPLVAGTYLNEHGIRCNEDLETYLIAQGKTIPKEDLCPYVIDFPAAPHLLAAEQGITLDLNHMVHAYQALQNKVEHVLTEGAGGFLTPINPHQDLSDFALRIQVPIILTIGIRLGCMNHSLLTLEAIEKRGLKLAGWVANCIVKDMPYQSKNIDALRTRMTAPLLGTIPFLEAGLQKPVNKPYALKAIEFAAAAIQLPTS
jgi:dethiobiotin synthetase